MDFSARNWAQQYETLKRQIQSKRINSENFSKNEVDMIQTSTDKLAAELKSMSNNPLHYELSASEIARRQVLMDSLKKQVMVLRANLASGGGGNGRSTSVAKIENSYNPMTTTDRGLIQKQSDVIKLQDEMIADIESGVDRLHGQAIAIGDETKSQVRLLDDLDTNVESATAALHAEAKHAAEIKDKARVCWMYVCIGVEVVILLLLVVVSFAS